MMTRSRPQIGKIRSVSRIAVVAALAAMVASLESTGARSLLAAEAGVAENVFPTPDRHTLQKLTDAERLISENRLAEAVRYLGDILEAEEDSFIQPDKQTPRFSSLKAEARRIMGRLPREGRDLYELQFGARARAMLDEALEARSPALLGEITRRFVHTRAGARAAFLLGLDYFERGRPLAGALCLQRLRDLPTEEQAAFEPALSLTLAVCRLQAGMAEKAEEALRDLQRRDPSVRWTVAGRETPRDSAALLKWLSGAVGRPADDADSQSSNDWPMFRGNPQRMAAASGGAPLPSLRWRLPGIDDPVLETKIEPPDPALAADQALMIPAFHPLVVGNLVLTRTLRGLVAADMTTGKRLWTAAADDADPSSFILPGNLGPMQTESPIEHRMLNDLTYGTLSSDGTRVFGIEIARAPADSDPANRPEINQLRARLGAFGPMQTSETAPPCNRLAAYDLGTGKVLWRLGGAAGPNASPLTEMFFLGPPLPLAGQLYVLAESKGEIRLLALEAATGELLWSQQLALAEGGPQAVRGWSGVSPSYADGVLVCPTAAGAIVGVELATRSLLWGYAYARDSALGGSDGNFIAGGFVRFSSENEEATTQHWNETSVCIVEGRVLATPMESNALHCLALDDGRLLWKTPRNNNLFLAHADAKRVVLVGRRSLRALRFQDGKASWGMKILDLPDGAAPAGRGFLGDRFYYLPLNDARLAVINFNTGKIVETLAPRGGDILGNLVAHRGMVLSQGWNGLEVFLQADAAKARAAQALAADPTDPAALALQGELFQSAGRRDEAIDSFRKACDAKADPRTRALLREAYFDGLRADFAAYRGRRDAIERALEDNAQRAEFLRLMIQGARKAGDPSAAFADCLKLADLEPNDAPLDAIDRAHSARRDRWVAVQLEGLRKEASGETAAAIDAAVEARAAEALKVDSIDALRRFLDFFGDLPGARGVRERLVAHYHRAGRSLDAEWAGLFQDSSAARPGGASADPGAEAWPTGNVEVKYREEKLPAIESEALWPIRRLSDPGEALAVSELNFDARANAVLGRDAWGREQWRVVLPRQRPGAAVPSGIYARAAGHCLLVLIGRKLAAIDLLGPSGRDKPRLLWFRDVAGENDAASNDPFTIQARFFFRQGRGIAFPFDSEDSEGGMGRLGPLTSRYVSYRVARQLTAVDPLTGDVLWVRRNLPKDCEVFGDEEYLLAVSPDREEAMLLRAADGESLGERKIARSSSQIQTRGRTMRWFGRIEETYLGAIGRRLLEWHDKPMGGHELALIDPVDGRDVWPRLSFPSGSRACRAGEQVAGVMEPSGRFALVSLADGRILGEAKLEKEGAALFDLTMFRSGDRYLLAVHRNSSPQRFDYGPQAVQNAPSVLIQRGKLYALDLAGQPLWPKPVLVKRPQ